MRRTGVIGQKGGPSMNDVYLSEIMTNLHPLDQYKIHFAKYDGNNPLDVYIGSFEEWKLWNMWSNGKNDFNRRFIFSLIDFYPERDTCRLTCSIHEQSKIFND